MFTLIISLLIPLTLVAVFKFLNYERKPPIFGVYQQKNKTYLLKFVVMYIFLRSRQLIMHLRRLRAVDVGRSDDGTIQLHELDAPLEKTYNLGDYPLAVDRVYFNGMSKEGAALVCGLARRAHHNVDAFMYLKVDGEELLLTPSLPDTRLTQTDVEQGQYRAEGISITNFMPMRTWELTYNGEMKTRTKDGTKKKIELNVIWSAKFSHFNDDYHMAPLNIASAMAREPWSADYFRLLKKCHQTHYEQMGHLEGTVSIDGVSQNISMPCVRDHSFVTEVASPSPTIHLNPDPLVGSYDTHRKKGGKYSEWRNFHRYVLHFIFLENGDCLTVGSVSQPVVMSHVTIGYMCRKADQTIFPIKASDFKLYYHGENEVPPTDYGFTFKAGGLLYAVQVKVNDEDTFFIGKDREAKFYERWCSVEVNDVKGWGCVEWQYNNTRQ